jgi:hypothetical protein
VCAKKNEYPNMLGELRTELIEHVDVITALVAGQCRLGTFMASVTLACADWDYEDLLDAVAFGVEHV